MFITNIFESPEPARPGYQSEADDQSVLQLGDLRKSRLTLAHLNRLRMASDVRKFEHEKNINDIQSQYKSAPEGGAPGGGGLGL